MTNTELFFAAYTPTPCQLLRVELRPLTLGARLLMRVQGNPFICGGVPTEADLMAGIIVCSTPFYDALNYFSDPANQKRITEWKKLVGKYDLADKAIIFAEYLKAGNAVPLYTFAAAGSSDVEIPDEIAVKVILMTQTSMSEAEILDRSWAKCVCDYIAIQSLKGVVTLTDRSAIANAIAVANAIIAKDAELKGAECQDQQ